MTFQYFIGLIVVTFALNFFVVAALGGLLGIFFEAIGGKHLKVIIRNTGFNW
ncbi:MAG TPA: hypothetical protein VMT81_02645 [Candidatus Paceibacterota bacterium]|nr:hypothetical protein [Candidatus Paceibacterota bacterium]